MSKILRFKKGDYYWLSKGHAEDRLDIPLPSIDHLLLVKRMGRMTSRAWGQEAYCEHLCRAACRGRTSVLQNPQDPLIRKLNPNKDDDAAFISVCLI